MFKACYDFASLMQTEKQHLVLIDVFVPLVDYNVNLADAGNIRESFADIYLTEPA
jgi:hypothetical protein